MTTKKLSNFTKKNLKNVIKKIFIYNFYVFVKTSSSWPSGYKWIRQINHASTKLILYCIIATIDLMNKSKIIKVHKIILQFTH